MLADEDGEVIDIPTCHIVGCDDPYIDGAMALYSMCGQDSAELFDHGSGHFVPREPQTLSELSAVIKAMVEKAESHFMPHIDSESMSESTKSLDDFSQDSEDGSANTSLDEFFQCSEKSSSRSSVVFSDCEPLDS